MMDVQFNLRKYERNTRAAQKVIDRQIANALNRSITDGTRAFYAELKKITRIPRSIAKNSLLRRVRARPDRLFASVKWRYTTFYPDKGEVKIRERAQGVSIRSYRGQQSHYPTAFKRGGRWYYRSQTTNRIRRLKGEPRLRGNTVLDSIVTKELTLSFPKRLKELRK